MPDVTFNCPHCQQHIEAPEEMVGMSAQCPTCQKDFQVPASSPTPSLRTPPFKRSPASPSTFKPTSTFAGPASLSCRSCGAQLDYNENSDVATCPFCGSTNFLFEPTSETDRLRDMEDGSFRVLHYEPQLSDAQVHQCIMEAVRRDPVGCLKIGDVSWKIERVFFPVWRIDAQVHCTWHGVYQEEVQFTNYMTVTKKRAEMRVRDKWTPGEHGPFHTEKQWVEEQVPYEEQEAYVDTKLQNRPASGVHDFQHEFLLPAAMGIDHAQVAACGFNPTTGPLSDGRPSTAHSQAIARLCLSQSTAWSKADGNQFVQQVAEAQCRAAVAQATISTVSCVIQSKQFSLAYLPVALLSYEWSGRRYRHFVNLVTGEFTGEWPKDFHRLFGDLRKEANAVAGTARSVAMQARKTNTEISETTIGKLQRGMMGKILGIPFVALFGIGAVWAAFQKEDTPTFERGVYIFLAVSAFFSIFGMLSDFRKNKKKMANLKANRGMAQLPAWESQVPWQKLLKDRRAILLHYFVNPPPNLHMNPSSFRSADGIDKVRQRVVAFLDGRAGAAQEAELNAVADHVAKCLIA